jgi:hypothetical protein
LNCDKCNKKDTCIELCDEAERYVSQDNEPQFTRGREITYSLNLVTQMSDTGISLREIEERKTQELLFYFQKIHGMKVSTDKAIMAMLYFEIPIGAISSYLKIPQRTLFDRMRKLKEKK